MISPPDLLRDVRYRPIHASLLLHVTTRFKLFPRFTSIVNPNQSTILSLSLRPHRRFDLASSFETPTVDNPTRVSPTLQLAPDRPPAFFPSRSNLPFSDDLKLPYQTFCATCSPALTSPPFYQLLHSHDQPPALALEVLFSGLTFTKTFHSVCERPLLAVS